MSQTGVNSVGSAIVSWKQFSHKQKNKGLKKGIFLLALLALIALLAPILANEKPLYMKLKGKHYFPAFTDLNPFNATKKYVFESPRGEHLPALQLDIADWKKLPYETILWCPIPYSPGKSDFSNSNYVSPFGMQVSATGENLPFRFRHLLGSGLRGEDVFAGLIHGTRTSMSIGLLSMLIAAFIGLSLGSLAGYFGDDRFKLPRATLVSLIFSVCIGYFYAFYIRRFKLIDAMQVSTVTMLEPLFISLIYFLGIVLLGTRIAALFKHSNWGGSSIAIPLDSIISRCIEIILSLPVFILIISIAAICKPSIFNIILIIGFTSWTSIARLTRAELLKVKKLEYIQAAHSLGYSHTRILFRHALINAMSPALVALAFGVAAAVLIESSLSFLGIGLPFDTVSWGGMLSEGRHQFSAWWMTLFPGIAIFFCVTLYNFLGETLRTNRKINLSE